jgi:hypothetical protein
MIPTFVLLYLSFSIMGSEFVTAVTVQGSVFWDMISCTLV